MTSRSAIKAHSTMCSDGAWDGAMNERHLREEEPASYYEAAYAWRDDSTDGAVKADYAFIHHMVKADGEVGDANQTACSTGIGILNGGRLRPGTRPAWAGDRQGIWRHLARHLEDADQTPPPLRERSNGGEMDRRAFTLDQLVIERRDGSAPKLVGHAAVFDQLSDPIFDFRERIRPGAFTKTLRDGADVRALFNHDPNYVLGRTKSGTLSLSEDAKGLAIEIQPPDTTFARDLMTSIERRDIDQMSFAFQAVRDEWVTEGGATVRNVIEAKLFDVSPVTYPAYPQTDVSARSLLQDVGLDWEQIASAIARAERSLTLTTADKETIQSAIETLNHYLPAAPSQGAHPAEGGRSGEPQGRVAMLRRRLELEELAV